MSSPEGARPRAGDGSESRLAGRSLSRRQLFATSGKAGLLAVSVGGLAGFLEACGTTTGTSGQATTAAGAPTRGGTLSAALTGNPTSMDPAVANIYTGDEVYDNIYTDMSPEQGH